jgi:hypothetical protein
MERAVEIYAVINFVVIGFSHLLQPRAWIAFFVALREKGAVGVFATAFMSLVFGSIIVAFHNVWTGLPLVLTLIGWAQVIKALIYFAFPQFGLRQLQIPSEKRSYAFVLAGCLFLLLAGVFGYHLWATARSATI